MDSRMAALLWTIAEEKKSFVSAAGPQNAGKSTVLFAMLDHIPQGTPVHNLTGEIEEIREFARSPDGGYLEVGEISDQRPARYIWGEPVHALFKTLQAGFSLTTTMHADGVADVFHQICDINEIADSDASTVQYVVHIKRFGEDKSNYWRRVDRVAEIGGVTGGVPDISQLFAWHEADDSFEELNPPRLLRATASMLAERAALIGLSAAGGG